MAFQRGDLVLVPFPFSDLSATKVRPVVVVSSVFYHSLEPDLLLAVITSKVAVATGPLDYLLNDWQAAGDFSPEKSKGKSKNSGVERISHAICSRRKSRGKSHDIVRR